MAGNDDRGDRLGSLELLPKDGVNRPTTGRAVFQTDSRAKGSDRRKSDVDRRAEVRMGEKRRTKTRRPKGAWDDVHD